LITPCYGCHSKLHERWSSGVCNTSRRPRTGLQAAKARGANLGGLRAKGIRMRDEANARAEALRPIPESLAGLPANAIAIELNKRNVPTPNGGRWHAITVIRMQRRLAAAS
jgi:hypothetical protein